MQRDMDKSPFLQGRENDRTNARMEESMIPTAELVPNQLHMRGGGECRCLSLLPRPSFRHQGTCNRSFQHPPSPCNRSFQNAPRARDCRRRVEAPPPLAGGVRAGRRGDRFLVRCTARFMTWGALIYLRARAHKSTRCANMPLFLAKHRSTAGSLGGEPTVYGGQTPFMEGDGGGSTLVQLPR